jgi:hypothetical protein
MSPGGAHHLEDLDAAGGVPAVMTVRLEMEQAAAIIGPGSILQNSTVSAFAIIFGVTSWSEEFPTDIV